MKCSVCITNTGKSTTLKTIRQLIRHFDKNHDMSNAQSHFNEVVLPYARESRRLNVNAKPSKEHRRCKSRTKTSKSK